MGGTFVQVSAGFGKDCGGLIDGDGQCWTANGTSEEEDYAGLLTMIAGGGVHAIGLDGSILSIDWAGNGTTLLDDGIYVDLAVAADFGCALRMYGHVRCFGSRVR